MRPIYISCNGLLAGLIFVLSLLVYAVNRFIYHYPGNNYFPDNTLFYVLMLFLIYWGVRLYFPKNTKPHIIIKESLLFFGVMALIAMATNAVQLTPFLPIDQKIIAFEAKLHIHLPDIMRWVNHHPVFKNILTNIYNSLPYQMSYLPILIIFSCRTHLLREYYFFMLCTTLLGFSFYYFFPTTAPASVMDPTIFSAEQIATGLKFQQIHHYIQPVTNEGGLIALPSFHVIWAILCVNLLKEWIIPCIFLAVINGLLIVSCVLLGWHYVTDVFGSIILLYISYKIFPLCARSANKIPRVC